MREGLIEDQKKIRTTRGIKENPRHTLSAFGHGEEAVPGQLAPSQGRKGGRKESTAKEDPTTLIGNFLHHDLFEMGRPHTPTKWLMQGKGAKTCS